MSQTKQRKNKKTPQYYRKKLEEQDKIIDDNIDELNQFIERLQNEQDQQKLLQYQDNLKILQDKYQQFVALNDKTFNKVLRYELE